jgi:hypothetical protein
MAAGAGGHRQAMRGRSYEISAVFSSRAFYLTGLVKKVMVTLSSLLHPVIAKPEQACDRV